MTTRTCQADKIWSNDSPSCDIKGIGACKVFIIIYDVASGSEITPCDKIDKPLFKIFIWGGLSLDIRSEI